ncbi:hypothetical protein GCM10008956_04090 [Deinococcus arenae]|uniref:Uncharacterized protein n=1 Tax=Deinococcus arenae TaxID=1452751 RepID=A0A8H9L548_9DEIO|nr:hypothetical protein [Deinococcus arenae]AWT35883.1 hypothetical protein DM785_10160 [Deinococcus actinosclerus]GGM31127.1 hypothetical protein GCM10008956_04090 [Deinococcus arenae]
MTTPPGTATSTDVIISYSSALPAQLAVGGLLLLLSARGALRWPLLRRVLLITGTVTLLVALLLARGLP